MTGCEANVDLRVINLWYQQLFWEDKYQVRNEPKDTAARTRVTSELSLALSNVTAHLPPFFDRVVLGKPLPREERAEMFCSGNIAVAVFHFSSFSQV